jgi:hypothetical protein
MLEGEAVKTTVGGKSAARPVLRQLLWRLTETLESMTKGLNMLGKSVFVFNMGSSKEVT